MRSVSTPSGWPEPATRRAKYLEGRNVPAEIWTEFALGHAPDAWDSIGKALGGAHPEDLLVEAGLLQPRAEGKGAYDRFRDRLLFVVRDERGRPVGFGGRALSPEGEPKYLNSPETPLFSKKRLLYGLSDGARGDPPPRPRRSRGGLLRPPGALARRRPRDGRVDGHRADARADRAAPPADRAAVVCYDGDSAGRNATHGALALLLGHGFAARAARMPAGEDPDDVLVREGPEALAARIDEAPDALTWLLEDVRPDEPGLDPAEKRARLGRILDVLSAMPDRILRYEEYRRLSDAVSVPLEVLWGGQKEAPRTARTRRSGGGNGGE